MVAFEVIDSKPYAFSRGPSLKRARHFAELRRRRARIFSDIRRLLRAQTPLRPDLVLNRVERLADLWLQHAALGARILDIEIALIAPPSTEAEWWRRFAERRRLEDLRVEAARIVRAARDIENNGEAQGFAYEIEHLGKQLIDILRELERRAWAS
jgi:hypothetical protein